ncbi:hypothetical protein THAOC_36187, partial [Thalassiosira oceanica]
VGPPDPSSKGVRPDAGVGEREDNMYKAEESRGGHTGRTGGLDPGRVTQTKGGRLASGRAGAGRGTWARALGTQTKGGRLAALVLSFPVTGLLQNIPQARHMHTLSLPPPSSARPRTPHTMSCVPVADGGAEVCANCGKQGSDIVKLKNCTACRLVKYCGVDCQRAHRKQHKRACKQRAAELKDEQLYSQAHPNNDADVLVMIQARVEKKDPVAINDLGEQYCHGELGLQKDMQKAVKLWTEAAVLGSDGAHFNLGNAYYHGKDGVEQDMAKAIQFWGKAAMRGHVEGRHNLGIIEGEKGNWDRAARHLLDLSESGVQGFG